MNDFTIDESSPKNKTRNHRKANSIQINMEQSKSKMKMLSKKNSSILYAHAKNKHSIKIEGASPRENSPKRVSGERKGFSGFNE